MTNAQAYHTNLPGYNHLQNMTLPLVLLRGMNTTPILQPLIQKCRFHLIYSEDDFLNQRKTLQKIQTGRKITRHRIKQSLLKPYHYILGKVTRHYNQNLNIPFRTAKHVCPSMQIYYLVTLPFPLNKGNNKITELRTIL